MQATGLTTLTLPEVDQYYFVMNLSLTASGSSFLTFTSKSGNAYDLQTLNFVKGVIQDGQDVNPSPNIGVYNDYEPFGLSGYFLKQPDGTHLYYFNLNGLEYKSFGHLGITGKTIRLNSASIYDWDIQIYTQPFNYSITFPNSFNVGGTLTGNVQSDVSFLITSGNLTFQQSLQPLLTGLTGAQYVSKDSGANIVLYDVDQETNNNDLTFNLQISSTIGNINNWYTVSRSGAFNGIYSSIVSNNDPEFQGIFQGVWSGNSFVPQENDQSIGLNFGVTATNGLGEQATDVVSYLFTPQAGGTLPAMYISGFGLTNSGNYTGGAPTPYFTSYYYVTGIDQDFTSLLFSSGCTGEVVVNYPTGFNNQKATGYLQMKTVKYKDIYGVGTQTFSAPTGYRVGSFGAYTGKPLATPVFGGSCRDIPAASGNFAWFRPFGASGALQPFATYLTGDVLMDTGNHVTGLMIDNIGSGYSVTYPPKVFFIRQPGDTSVGDATGVFTMNTGSSYSTTQWGIQTGFAGTTLIDAGLSGSFNTTPVNNSISFQITLSGMVYTTPVSGTLALSDIYGTNFIETITGTKTYNPDPDALKKNFNPTGAVFLASSSLSFLTTQNELDTIYSGPDFTNNNWPFTVGDLDF